MRDKVKILESWIMVEHLSEGDISKNDKNLLTFEDIASDDYYSLFRMKIEKKGFRKNQKGGLVVFLDLFEFKDVIEYLRKEYKLEPPVEEIQYGSKFSLALYFDKNLGFLQDMTFLTVSGYIKNCNKVPKAEEFSEFETELKTRLGQYFDFNDNDNDDSEEETDKKPEPDQEIDPLKFNEAFERALCIYGEKIDINDCRIQLVNSIESDATNLHSFFIEDLEKAKKISTENLDKYLMGNIGRRANLDSKNDSENFNPSILESILEPKNYPLGRFPSNTKFALSFMQQIAVNLSVGYDNSQIRSVNGPPGTGKTTLLKDIFAELVVEQAKDICDLKDKYIPGTEKTRYYDKASIGIVPEKIAENSIVVASSNNGAVQNIVNELPLISGIDEKLISKIEEADYFKDISNSSVSTEWKDGKPEIVVTPKEEELFWGLFSLEGGRQDNVTGIISCIKEVTNYFENEYEDDDEIYDEFKKKYKAVESLRKKAQKFANSYKSSYEDKERLGELRGVLPKEKAAREREYNDLCLQTEKKIDEFRNEIGQLNDMLQDIQHNSANNDHYKNDIYQYLQTLSSQKPGIFAKKSVKEKYDYELIEAQAKLKQIIEAEHVYIEKAEAVKKQIKTLNEEIQKEKSSLDKARIKLGEWIQKSNSVVENLSNEIKKTEGMLSNGAFTPLDLDISYEELQLSNPWFQEDYRIAQSELFVTALRVRKQFLYENKKNLNAACNIWNNQKSYLENKLVIETAWSWINMAIPVISSTFASFGRMCKNLGKNTLGHLFIDEAGQALPQAAVGAIFRSRHVMVVGDPAQIKPVLTLDPNVLGLLGKHFGVSEKYLSESASTQTLVDAVSQYGYYRDKEMTEESWIGIPLWVHRRCQYPMFTISNKISYGNLMVQGNPKDGKAGWYDVKGKANNKYVEEQGEFLLEKIKEMIAENPKIVDKNEKDVIYVISPFSNVAYQLSQKLKKIGFTRYNNGKPTNIGTIHTFQGKEAPIVFMVLGADKQSSGAARWAVSEPNMMNVAATRAKEEFYIIGDKDLYLKTIKCDVATDTNKVIQKYKKEHPELVREIEDVEKSNEEYIGNIKNKTFHIAGCKWAPTTPEKKVVFNSKDEALSQGFKPCKTCLP